LPKGDSGGSSCVPPPFSPGASPRPSGMPLARMQPPRRLPGSEATAAVQQPTDTADAGTPDLQATGSNNTSSGKAVMELAKKQKAKLRAEQAEQRRLALEAEGGGPPMTPTRSRAPQPSPKPSPSSGKLGAAPRICPPSPQSASSDLTSTHAPCSAPPCSPRQQRGRVHVPGLGERRQKPWRESVALDAGRSGGQPRAASSSRRRRTCGAILHSDDAGSRIS
jgi:hypothetical protein